jgi:hypothetical protein
MNANQLIERHKAQRSGWFIVVPALACLQLNGLAWAASEAPDVEKPTTDISVHPDRQQLEAIIRDRYPQLVTQRFAGFPVVTVLLNHDDTVAATDLQISAKDPGEVKASELHFARFGLKATDLSYIGVERFDLPLNSVLVVFGGRNSSDPVPRPGAR